MRRKVVVSGPIHGPVVERAVDRGPGAAVSRAKRDGHVLPFGFTSDGVRVPGGSDPMSSHQRKTVSWYR